MMDIAWAEFSQFLDPSQRLCAAEATNRFGKNTLGASRHVSGCLYPKSAAQIVKIMQITNRHRVPIYPVSTGNNWGYGCATPTAEDNIIVHLGQMNRIVAFDEERGIIRLEPGVTLGQLWQYLHEKKSPFLAPVTGAGPKTSLVGNALERGYGVTSYFDSFASCLGLKAILPDGTGYQSPLMADSFVELGHKWGVGPYLDGIFTCANFGVVTEMAFALKKAPMKIPCVLFEMSCDDQVIQAIQSMRTLVQNLGTLMGPLKITSHHKAIAQVTNRDCLKNKSAWLGFLGVYAQGALQKAALDEIQECLRPFSSTFEVVFYDRNTDTITGEDNSPKTIPEADLCRMLAGKPTEFAIAMAYLRSGKQPSVFTNLDPQRDGCGIRWFSPLVPFTRDAITRYLGAFRAISQKHDFQPGITLTSLSDRCMDSAVAVMFNRDCPIESAKTLAWIADFSASCQKAGFFPYRFTTAMMDQTIGNSGHRDLHGRIKTALDPNGLLAPGRYLPV